MELEQTRQSKGIVKAFLEALNRKDFDKAESMAAKDMVFEGVMGRRDGSEAYFTDMRKMQLEYEVLKIIAEGNDVSVLYTINMANKKIFTSGWYTLKNDRISTIKVLFDPRPLLEDQKS